MIAIAFSIPRKPVSVNATYIRAGFGKNRGTGGGKGLILSKDARQYKACAKLHATFAAKAGGWPPPETVKGVELEFVTWNTRHDSDAPVKLTADAFEGVLYKSDRVVRSVKASKAKDAGSPRVVVTARLLEVAA